LTLGRSLEVFADAVGGPRNAFYVPSSATFDRAENYAKDAPAVTAGALPAIRDLRLVDGATAQLAQTVGLQLADDDTVPRQE
jgi:hypothetical protein